MSKLVARGFPLVGFTFPFSTSAELNWPHLTHAPLWGYTHLESTCAGEYTNLSSVLGPGVVTQTEAILVMVCISHFEVNTVFVAEESRGEKA